MNQIVRSNLQIEADRLDLEIYRALSFAESLLKQHPRRAVKLSNTMLHLREARTEVRALMHDFDRQRTR